MRGEKEKEKKMRKKKSPTVGFEPTTFYSTARLCFFSSLLCNAAIPFKSPYYAFRFPYYASWFYLYAQI